MQVHTTHDKGGKSSNSLTFGRGSRSTTSSSVLWWARRCRAARETKVFAGNADAEVYGWDERREAWADVSWAGDEVSWALLAVFDIALASLFSKTIGAGLCNIPPACTRLQKSFHKTHTQTRSKINTVVVDKSTCRDIVRLHRMYHGPQAHPEQLFPARSRLEAVFV